MGSWANSLHVRHKDPHAVIEAIKSLMAQGLAKAEYPDLEPAIASESHPSGSDAEASPELEDAIARGDDEAVAEIITREALAFAPDGPITMHDGSEMLPPHIFVIQQRMAGTCLPPQTDLF